MTHPLVLAFVMPWLIFFAVSRCAPPPVSELLKGGIDCDVAITMPPLERDPQAGEEVKVKARFSNCHEVGK